MYGTILMRVHFEEYQSEMQAAENSGFISVEEHKKNMNKWLKAKFMSQKYPLNLSDGLERCGQEFAHPIRK